jgi:hypothetical protein
MDPGFPVADHKRPAAGPDIPAIVDQQDDLLTQWSRVDGAFLMMGSAPAVVMDGWHFKNGPRFNKNIQKWTMFIHFPVRKLLVYQMVFMSKSTITRSID